MVTKTKYWEKVGGYVISRSVMGLVDKTKGKWKILKPQSKGAPKIITGFKTKSDAKEYIRKVM